MSHEQLQQIIGLLRSGAGPDLTQPPSIARRQFTEMLSSIPVPDAVEFESVTAGGVPAFWSRTRGVADDRILLYLHGGGFVIGDAWSYRSLWSSLAAASGARGLGIDYRLAPEHPFPAAVEDAIAAYRWLLECGHRPGAIVLAGDSAGGGLVISALVQMRRLGLLQPAAALAISPWADLTCSGESIQSKATEDPSLTPRGLLNCAAQYLGSVPPEEPLASPVLADLSGLPPLLIQVGSIEILLDDSIRLARRAGAAGAAVRLEIWPGMPHVWHAFGFMLDEGHEATRRAGEFLRSCLGENAD